MADAAQAGPSRLKRPRYEPKNPAASMLKAQSDRQDHVPLSVLMFCWQRHFKVTWDARRREVLARMFQHLDGLCCGSSTEQARAAEISSMERAMKASRYIWSALYLKGPNLAHFQRLWRSASFPEPSASPQASSSFASYKAVAVSSTCKGKA
jgi:hypothetical protein